MADAPDGDTLEEMRAVLAELRAEVSIAREEATVLREEVQAAQAEARADRDDALRELDRAARAGDLGPAGERLARLVRHGERSWLDVLHGRDASPEAEAVRQVRADDLVATIEQLVQDDPDLAQQLGRGEATGTSAGSGEGQR